MNIFVLSTGRCGTVTFARACKHITNYTISHERNVFICGPGRLTYPENHIEVDNRLSWFLGRLDEKYGRDALYTCSEMRRRLPGAFAVGSSKAGL